MANIIEILIKAKDETQSAFSSALSGISGIGTSMQTMGKNIAMATAPIALGLGIAVSSAMAFDTSMTNVGAVMGKTRTQMQGLSTEILNVGKNSRAGPQAAAEAFYDIAGGVADASAHMGILEAAIATSEAGAADLGDTTSALIAVMNSYQFAADDAAYASDVLTRTVGMGVGSMSDFASALPTITGLANSLEISFGDLAGATAYLTTQGNTASQATTQLSAMMTSMLNPNESMKKGLTELGFATGEAAVEQLGLVGAMNALKDTNVANTDGMAKMLGSTEALRGVTALAGPEFKKFAETFTSGIQGATAAAQAIQLDSPAAQLDLLKSKMSAMGITIGTTLLPSLLDLADKFMPIVDGVLAWAEANPEATTTLVGVAMAAVAAGPIIGVMGMAITAVTTAIGILLSPAVLLAGAIAAIVAAAQIGYPGGIVGLLNDAAKSAQMLAIMGLGLLSLAATAAQTVIEGFTGTLRENLKRFQDLYDKSPEFRTGLLAVAGAAGIAAAAFGLLQLKIAATAGVQFAAGAAVAGLTALKAGLAAAALAASGGIGAFMMSLAPVLAPIAAVSFAILGLVAAISHFNEVTAQARDEAQKTAAAGLAAGKLTEQDIYDQSFKSAQAEHGDLFARLFYSNIGRDVIGDTKISGQRAEGGGVIGGMSGRRYLVGEEGPEMLDMRPGTSGTIVPNDQLGGGGGVNFNGPMNFYGNTKEEGAAMAEGFVTRFDELARQNGLVTA